MFITLHSTEGGTAFLLNTDLAKSFEPGGEYSTISEPFTIVSTVNGDVFAVRETVEEIANQLEYVGLLLFEPTKKEEEGFKAILDRICQNTGHTDYTSGKSRSVTVNMKYNEKPPEPEEDNDLHLFEKHCIDGTIVYAYGPRWVEQALFMDDMGYPTPEAAKEAWRKMENE